MLDALRIRLRARAARRALNLPLHVCVECASGLVNPVRREQWGDARLAVLRCADCGHERAGLFPEDVYRAYEHHLDATWNAVRTSLLSLLDERERRQA